MCIPLTTEKLTFLFSAVMAYKRLQELIVLG